MSTPRRAGPFGPASSRPVGRAETHIHIARIVVDRAALAGSSVRGLHDEVADRLTHRLDGGAESDAIGNKTGLSDSSGLPDAIAGAVAEHVSRLDVARADARRRR